ncbi:uncharacterized protein LOC124605307 [Schistocerca americana]|uniref:uncharacterized protein LOC124605307 n=1 Tax=Schistocerca americana TaxID=7009 RepID=UPI001F4FBC9B|nr:uncharacterized protein LOC124605307 [Schistocerca americana]
MVCVIETIVGTTPVKRNFLNGVMVKIGMEVRQVWGACAGVGSHWALGVLLLLGLAAEDWSGPAALLSLVIAFTVALLTGRSTARLRRLCDSFTVVAELLLFEMIRVLCRHL